MGEIMNNQDVNKIRKEIAEEVEKTISRYIIIGGSSHRIGNKHFNIEVRRRLEEKFSHLIFEDDQKVFFKTKSYGEFIESEGVILNSYWKDIDKLIALHDIETEDGKVFRVITDPERYPDDFITAIS